jgi:hypothetical protein
VPSKAHFAAEKEKGQKLVEASGGAGIEKCLEDRMNAGFLLIHYEKYR